MVWLGPLVALGTIVHTDQHKLPTNKKIIVRDRFIAKADPTFERIEESKLVHISDLSGNTHYRTVSRDQQLDKTTVRKENQGC